MEKNDLQHVPKHFFHISNMVNVAFQICIPVDLNGRYSVGENTYNIAKHFGKHYISLKSTHIIQHFEITMGGRNVSIFTSISFK